MGKCGNEQRGWGQILEGPSCYPGINGKYFKFWRKVVRFIQAPPTARKWRHKGEGGNKQKEHLRGHISRVS